MVGRIDQLQTASRVSAIRLRSHDAEARDKAETAAARAILDHASSYDDQVLLSGAIRSSRESARDGRNTLDQMRQL